MKKQEREKFTLSLKKETRMTPLTPVRCKATFLGNEWTSVLTFI